MTFKNFFLIVFLCVICTNLTAAERGQADERTYTLGPHDLITISVFGVDELNTKVRVSGTGTITLPLLGEIPVEGLSPAQLELKLAKLLEKEYLKNAQVTVFIEEYRSKKVSVIGAVQNPGNYEILGKETLLQMVSRAGGLTDRASDRIVVIRGEESRVIDLDELMTKGPPELNIPLEPGDIVNVPHERFIDVYIFGEVRNPGTLKLKKSGETTLLKAIAQAGGFTTRARRGAVRVTRKQNGEELKFKVNIKKILQGKNSPFILEHNDVVYVPESLL